MASNVLRQVEHAVCQLEALVEQGDFLLAGVMFGLTARNVEALGDERQVERLRKIGETLGRSCEPPSSPAVPAFRH